MTDPLRPKGKPEPRRAEPMRPDAPGSGDSAETTPGSTSSEESLDRALEQERTAVDNVRDA